MISDDLSKTLARMPKTFVFYDLETSGLVPEYDQILQAAALRTDRDFSEPDDPADILELRARRQPWVVPSPAALMATGIAPARLDQGWRHHELMFRLSEQFSAWGPALYIGYNSLRFDERFLRNGFYRSVLSPYLTQQRGSARADLMVIAQAIAALAPDAISVPVTDDGRRTFRLGPLCRGNGVALDEANAHDALADVRATLYLARTLRAAAPKTFDSCLALADKRHARDILQTSPYVLRLRTITGTPMVRPLVPIGLAPGDPNCAVCIDIAADPTSLFDEDVDGLRQRLAERSSPIVAVRLNAHEMIFPIDGSRTSERLLDIALSWSLDDASAVTPSGLWAATAVRIAADPAFKARVLAAVAAHTAAQPTPLHVDERLYSGGFADADYRYGRRLHQACPWEPQGSIVACIRDPRLREFAMRILYEAGAESLDPEPRARYDAFVRARVLGTDPAPWRTLAAARAELTALMEGAADRDAQRLREIGNYFDRIEIAARAGAPA